MKDKIKILENLHFLYQINQSHEYRKIFMTF